MSDMLTTTRIVILDTEYTSWKGCVKNGWNNRNSQYREIVQIAAVLVDVRTLELEDLFNELIRPQINPELSDYFISLTDIEQGNVDTAQRFEPVMRSFLKWVGTDPIYTWGEEVTVLEENIKLYESDIDINSDQFHDIRLVFEEYGIPVDEYTSGTVSEFFNARPRTENSHNALYDCRSLFVTLCECQTQFEGNGE
jgi:inhibitor of KinA sporulation pathway (predicted exonuclease)